MSPLRRAWLAWSGGAELPIVAGCLMLYAVMVIAALNIPGHHGRPFDERPFAFLLFMPMPLGLRLRRLLTDNTLVLAHRHTAWVLRWFCLVILPLAALGTAVPLALTDIPPLWALAVAACLVVVGSWMGFTCLSSIPAAATAFVLVNVLSLVGASSSGAGDAVAIATLILVAASVRVAWQRLEARAVPTFASWTRSPRLERLTVWFDDRLMSQPSIVAAHAGLPTLATAARLGLSGLGGSWVLRLIGLVGMGVGAFIFTLSNKVPNLHDRLTGLLFIATLMACAIVPGWLNTAQPRTGQPIRRLIRELLATERLRPLSRRGAAAATLLAIIGNGLSSVLPLTGGMLLGLVLADAWQGRDSIGLWLLVPQAVAATVGSAAVMILLQFIPRMAAIVGAMLVVGALFGLPLLAIRAGVPDVYPSGTLLIVGLALVLVPLAWWRLAEAELP